MKKQHCGEWKQPKQGRNGPNHVLDKLMQVFYIDFSPLDTDNRVVTTQRRSKSKPLRLNRTYQTNFSEKQKKQEMERKKELEKSMAFGEYRYFRKSNNQCPT